MNAGYGCAQKVNGATFRTLKLRSLESALVMVCLILQEMSRLTNENKNTHRELDDLRQETDRVRRERDDEHMRAEKRLRSMQSELESMRLSARKNKCALISAREELDRNRGIADALKKQTDLNAVLKSRVSTLEQTVKSLKLKQATTRAQRAGGRVVSAIEKLAKNPSVGKRLAAAVHPDKAPAECSELATELFKFVQGARDSDSF